MTSQGGRMKRFINLVVFILFIISGCSNPLSDDPENFCVEIFNDTDRVVSIYYAVEEEDSDGDVIVSQEAADIEIGDSIQIQIEASFWDGKFTAEYGGILKTYEVDEELFDCRDIYIEIGDFEAPEQ